MVDVVAEIKGEIIRREPDQLNTADTLNDCGVGARVLSRHTKRIGVQHKKICYAPDNRICGKAYYHPYHKSAFQFRTTTERWILRNLLLQQFLRSRGPPFHQPLAELRVAQCDYLRSH